MKIIGKVLLVMMIALLVGGLLVPNGSVVAQEQMQQYSASLKGKALNERLHKIYEGAWLRASEYTDLQENEMPKFPEESVFWTMSKEIHSVDPDMNGPNWTTDIFATGNMRALAWYKAAPGLRVEKGVSLPINVRIEMQVTLSEILEYEHYVEGILVHEMIHYIHHMRVMNLKGWMTMWPGDGHNYMAYLKYVRGYDFPANKY